MLSKGLKAGQISGILSIQACGEDPAGPLYPINWVLLSVLARQLVSTIIAKLGISQELVDPPLPEPVPDGSEERPRPPASRNPCRPADVAQLRTLLREHSRDAVIHVTLGRRAGRDGAPEIVARIRVIDPFSQWVSTVIPIGQPVEPAKHSPEFVADALVTEP